MLLQFSVYFRPARPRDPGTLPSGPEGAFCEGPVPTESQPTYRILVLVQLAVAGTVLAHSLLALEARLVVVVRLEGLQAHPAGAGPSSWLLLGRRPSSAGAAAAVVIIVVQIAAGGVLLLLLLSLLLIAGRAVAAAGVRIRRNQRGAWRHFINFERRQQKGEACNQLRGNRWGERTSSP